jgi:hypothetical protein
MGYLIIVKVIIDSQVCGYENIHVIIITAITIVLVLLLILLYILVLSSIVFANNKYYNIQIHIFFIIEYYLNKTNYPNNKTLHKNNNTKIDMFIIY